jgi:hypothetical protein
VLEKLTSVNLKINPDKCTWFRTSLYLLGFIVGPGITKIDHRRLSNIDKWPIPKNAAQVRSIMGVISHLRDYCPMLSKVAAPLDQLRNDKDVYKPNGRLYILIDSIGLNRFLYLMPCFTSLIYPRNFIWRQTHLYMG